MDDIDRKLFRELMENGRATISVLSSKVSLSMPAVSERIRRMEKDGFIGGFTVMPGERFREAFPLVTQTMIKLGRADNSSSFKKFLDSRKYITWYGMTTGHFDWTVHIMARDTNELENILSEIKSRPEIADVESTLLLKQKNKYTAKFL